MTCDSISTRNTGKLIHFPDPHATPMTKLKINSMNMPSHILSNELEQTAIGYPVRPDRQSFYSSYDIAVAPSVLSLLLLSDGDDTFSCDRRAGSRC